MPEDNTSTQRAESRRLAAIMFTDIVGFSRQMGADEARMLRLLDVHNQIIQHAVGEHHGTVIKTVGDAFLVDFPSVVHAVQCAQHIQTQFHSRNAEKEPAEQIHIRIGIHCGDIVQRNGDVFGDGVNIAARLQALAEPDAICISDMVYRDVAQKVPLGPVVSLGRPKLKGIARSFPVYALLPEPAQGIRRTLHVRQWRLKHSQRVWQVAAVVLVGGVVSAGTLVIKMRYFPTAPQSLLQDSAPTNTPSLPLPDKPSIVILPFDNMSGDPQQDYFSSGITEVLTSDLSRLSSLFVIARNTAFTYKGKATNVQAIGKELGVRYVLEGSVQKADEQVRIVAQLVDTTTDTHVWSEHFDRPFKEIFALQDDIVQKIVTTLKLQLTVWEQGVLVRKTTDNLEAYDDVLRGLATGVLRERLTPEALLQARQLWESALALDPHYATAYALVSSTYFIAWFYMLRQDPDGLEHAFALAQQAVALEDSLPLAHRMLGMVYLQQKQHEQALSEAQRAVALDPNDADSAVSLGLILAYMGRPQEAIAVWQQAMRLNPRYPSLYPNALGWGYFLTRRYDEGITVLKAAITRNPQYPPLRATLAMIYSEVGREEEARAEGAIIMQQVPTFSVDLYPSGGRGAYE